MLRQIQDFCNLSFVFFDIFLTRGILDTDFGINYARGNLFSNSSGN